MATQTPGQSALQFQRRLGLSRCETAFQMLHRNHGRIESREHWLMEVPEHLKRAIKYWAKLQDVSFRADASKVRRDEGPANLACLRRLALKRETSLESSIRNKRSRAGWDPAYMRKV